MKRAITSRSGIPKSLGEMLELRRAESVDVDVRIFFPDVAEQIEIPIEAELRMMPALHQDLHAAGRGQFVELLIELLAREHVVVGILLGPIKRAELAIDVADVGVVDVAIDDVGDDFATAAVVAFRFARLRRASARAPSSASGQR